MRLKIDRWSSSQTALELIPYKRARPTAGYFRAGRRLLDSLTHALPDRRLAGRPGQPATTAGVTPRRPGYLVPGSPGLAGPTPALLTRDDRMSLASRGLGCAGPARVASGSSALHDRGEW